MENLFCAAPQFESPPHLPRTRHKARTVNGAGPQASGEFCAIAVRPGPARVANAGQGQRRRITGSAPLTRTCKRLRVGDMRRTFPSPHSLQLGRGCHKNRTPRGEGSTKNRFSGVNSAGHFRRSLPPSQKTVNGITMSKKGDTIHRNSKKSQKKQQKKYNVYSQKTVRIKEALREKQ